jgi:hypothetical protein
MSPLVLQRYMGMTSCNPFLKLRASIVVRMPIGKQTAMLQTFINRRSVPNPVTRRMRKRTLNFQLEIGKLTSNFAYQLGKSLCSFAA